MKICVFSRSTPIHFASGGMEKHCFSICNGFSKYGFKVTLITTSDPDGVNVYEKINENFEIYFLKGTKPGKYSFAYWQESVKKFLEIYNKDKFDIVFSESAGALSLVKYKIKSGLQIPIIFRMPGTALRDAISQLRQISIKSKLAFFKNIYNYFRDKKWFKYVDSFIVCSNEIKENLVRYYKIVPEKVFVVYNGVYSTKFFPYNGGSKKILYSKYKIGGEEKIILTVSRLKKEKGIHLLLHAFSKIVNCFDNLKLFVVGRGPYKKSLEKLMMKLKLSDKVKFLDFIPNELLPEIYNLADVFVLPTLAKEGLPFVIIEAMACGVPVVATKIGGIPEIISHYENGLLVEPGNIPELTDAIIQLLRDSLLKEKFIHNGLQIVREKFTEDMMVKETIEVLKKYVKIS
ncbi:MAG: glycosyltransferase family 4 protein [Endomicrobia bacterium]|nr:glycosyltransferase family 4 protein [Endomicrobiia bacterium]